jgi:hypothetical protein
MKLQYPIIGITGRASAGKDTVGNYICKAGQFRGKTVAKLGCADQLKRICSEVFYEGFGVPHAAFYGTQDEKEAPLETVPGWSGRRILQYVGTEGFRHIHEEVWARAMIGRARSLIDDTSCKMVVVCDVRFLTEAAVIKEAGGMIVRVKRPEADSVISVHASETQLSFIQEDYVIDNQGKELYLLEKLVGEFLCQLNF